MTTRIAPVAPSLPLAAEKYDPRNIEQITRALRLYFAQLDLLNRTTITDLDSATLVAGNAEQKAVQALSYINSLIASAYGAFYDTTSQFAAVASTAYAMTFNSTDTTATSGFYIGTPTSRVYTVQPGVYNIQFSAQLLTNAGSTHNAWIWFRKNGTNIPNSSTLITITGNNTAVVAAWNFAIEMIDGDYFELMWESDDTHIYLATSGASAVHPAIPSIILTVTPFSI